MLFFELQADRIVLRVGEVGEPIRQAHHEQHDGIAADGNAGLAFFDFDQRRPADGCARGGFAFDAFGMEEIAAGERTDIRRIRCENGAAKALLDVKSRTHSNMTTGLGGQELQPQSAALLAHKVPRQPAAVTAQPVPDGQQLARNVAQQMLQKLHHLRAADRAGKEAKVKIPPGHARHGRQRLPVEVVLQHRRLSFRRPGAAPMRPLTQSAFIDEDDDPPLFLGFFLISGQRFCFQRRMAASSRSRARPVGRWQLHPSCRRIRHACPGW